MVIRKVQNHFALKGLNFMKPLGLTLSQIAHANFANDAHLRLCRDVRARRQQRTLRQDTEQGPRAQTQARQRCGIKRVDIFEGLGR